MNANGPWSSSTNSLENADAVRAHHSGRYGRSACGGLHGLHQFPGTYVLVRGGLRRVQCRVDRAVVVVRDVRRRGRRVEVRVGQFGRVAGDGEVPQELQRLLAGAELRHPLLQGDLLDVQRDPDLLERSGERESRLAQLRTAVGVVQFGREPVLRRRLVQFGACGVQVEGQRGDGVVAGADLGQPASGRPTSRGTAARRRPRPCRAGCP